MNSETTESGGGQLHLVVPKVRDEIAAAGMTQAAAADEIGISDSALSQWLRGSYGGDNAEIARKCGTWLTARSERASLEAILRSPPRWVETPASKRVLSALGYAQMARDIAVVHGAAGSGKTTAAQRYAETHPSVWLATMTEGKHAVGACLRNVAAAVKVRPAGRSIAACEDAIAERLRGTGGLLVVDEAQCLALRSLNALRQIHDATSTGLALIGGETLWETISGGRRPGLAQLFSRVGQRAALKHPGPKDADPLLAGWEGIGDDARAAARRIAVQPGGLRSVVKVVNWAQTIANGDGVGPAHVAAAWKRLGGDSETA